MSPAIGVPTALRVMLATALSVCFALAGSLAPTPAEAAVHHGAIGARAAASSECPIDQAALVWGFKETFRSYISGTIAHGEWTTAGGAAYATPDFSWGSGSGAFDRGSGSGLVGFSGSITFTGHGGILNTTVGNPQLRFDGGGAAVLLLDVSGTTQDGAAIDRRGVEFAAVDLGSATRTSDGVIVTLEAAPASLLEAGAAAFGTYEAGEPLDPITLRFTTTAECSPIVAERPVEPTAATDPGWQLLLAGGIVMLALLSLLVAWLVHRRRV
ncbi:MAG TPA: HtaA domain-containing protein [Terrimesophilobacter sp.]|uniref:HtaA domain-containing protein n=1 Tax=Terrimesophilobacter sp. TaxID=2906435 RepID=UPI002F9405EC